MGPVSSSCRLSKDNTQSVYVKLGNQMNKQYK